MKTILLTLAATSLTLIATSASQANPNSGHSPGKSGSMHSSHNNYHLSHGTKFDHGYFYRGRHHEHWGETRYERRYGCNVYWDRCLNSWYYWCERDICYYPVTYCPYRTYVCPRVVVEPVRPVIRPVVVEPVRPIAVVPINVRVNVEVNVQTATALPRR